MTSPLLLEVLDSEDVEQAVKLARSFKDRFAPTARDIIRHAEQIGLSDYIAPLAIAAECLLLSAYLFPGDRQTFLEHAGAAFDHAAKNSPVAKVQ